MRRIVYLYLKVGPLVHFVSFVVILLVEYHNRFVFVILHNLNRLDVSIVLLIGVFQRLEIVNLSYDDVVQVPVELRIQVRRLNLFKWLQDLDR